ncbi:MAG: basic secretory protein-like protein [Candidatus Cryptobacteroides sp.]|nr:basic secretory protein-like protein [Bacteroidales bacterium]MDY2860953.1 basic secretory protein-like protein [Candidatus Cryptobacteroides sp.]MDY5495904.1 basic secretory protein-like protein [Candidatus Cryptobacteroides sp.]
MPPSLPTGIEYAGGEVRDEWKDFVYPEVKFSCLNPETRGAKLYSQLVPDPESFIKEHCRKVAEILFYSASDPMNHVGRINYILKDYDGVSAKAGNPEETTVYFSTRHVEKSAAQSMFKLDYETRGVLFHELVHAYQFEPKGIGTYSTNKEFWACIEGLADAVRAQAGYFDIAERRRPGGNWLDGYQTTGFFIQWLTTKDPDAIRKFHQSVRDLEVWSFDGAMKYIFGKNASIQGLWDEYQAFLNA